jgi:hypothetical protein
MQKSKVFSFLFSLVVASCALFTFACQQAEKPKTASFRDFNLAATVEKMNIVQLEPRTGGCSVSTSLGETAERRSGCTFEYLLNERNSGRFDEAVFLNELKSEVAGQIGDAVIQANGTSNDGFYFTFSKAENRGSIEVIGSRVEGNKYKLWCVVRESAEIESDK